MQPETSQDTRLPNYTAPSRRSFVLGCRFLPALAALTASALAFGLTPGEIVVDDYVYQYPGDDSITVGSGTMAASKEIKSVTIAYYSPTLNRVVIAQVDGAAAAHGSAEWPTEAELLTAAGGNRYTVVIGVVFRTDGSSVVSLYQVDYTCRSFDVDTVRKFGLDNRTPDDVTGDVYRFHSRMAWSIDAADIANGDVITEAPLPPIFGKVNAWRVVCEKAISTSAKTATLNLEIGTTNVTSTATAYAGTKALGVVTELTAPTAANTFGPGDKLSVEAASVTAFTEGRVRIEVDIFERMF
jgi:hypothetical protein